MSKRRATRSRVCREASRRRGTRSRARHIRTDGMARQHLGQAGHPARLQAGDLADVHRPWELPVLRQRRPPSKPLDIQSGVRIVPGGSAVRDGAYVGKGVICMPPMYINIGAWVGEGSLVDSHALVGSCAQVGRRCTSAPAPRSAACSSRWAHARDHRRRRPRRRQLRRLRGRGRQARAVSRPASSSPLDADLRSSPLAHPRAGTGRSADGSGGRRGRAGHAPVTAGKGRTGDSPSPHPSSEVSGRAHRSTDGARSNGFARRLALAQGADRHRFDDRAGDEGGDVAGRAAEEPRIPGRRAARRATAAQHVCDARPAGVVFSTHLYCVPPFFPSRVEKGRLFGRGACDAKGILAAQVVAAERLRRSGGRRLGMLFVVGEERGSDGATRPIRPHRPSIPHQW